MKNMGILLGAFLVGAVSSLSGAIEYSGLQDVTLTQNSNESFQLEFGGISDSVIHIVDERGAFVMFASPFTGNYDFIPDEDRDRNAAAFDFEMEVGADFEWSQLTGARIRLAAYREENAFPRGQFFDQADGYLPLRTVFDDSEFYGWLRMSHSMEEELFTVHDWAWNSAPGEPILAGQIPEPKVYVLLLGIGALVFVAGRRRQLRRKMEKLERDLNSARKKFQSRE